MSPLLPKNEQYHQAECSLLARSSLSFHPRPLPTLLLALVLPCFISLGFWQLDRAHGRQAAEQLLKTHAAAPAIALPATVASAESLHNQHVMASGRYEPAYQFFLDNRVWHGQAGYDVITPLHVAGSKLSVLVDRGWIPAPADRRELPDVATPGGAVDVDGLAVIPASGTFSLGQPSDRWEPIWQKLNLDRFQRLAGVPIQPVVIRLSPQSAAGGFEREWPRADAGATRNLGYAVQWFGFAVIAVVLWLWSAVKPEGGKS
ncbi:MAG: SURF1 family protein [Georgfuchsia sp.]